MYINNFFGHREVTTKKISSDKYIEINTNSIKLLYRPLPTGDAALLPLAANIRKHGLFEPIKVYRDKENYYLLAGARRLAAHKLLGKNFIRAKVYKELSEADAVLVSENIFSHEKSILIAAQLARYYCELRGFSIVQTASLFEMSIVEINNLLKIASLSWEEVRRISASSLTNKDICTISKITDPMTRFEIISKLYAKDSRLTQAISEVKTERHKPKFCPAGLLDNSFKRLVCQISDIGKKANLEKSTFGENIIYTITISE